MYAIGALKLNWVKAAVEARKRALGAHARQGVIAIAIGSDSEDEDDRDKTGEQLLRQEDQEDQEDEAEDGRLIPSRGGGTEVGIELAQVDVRA